MCIPYGVTKLSELTYALPLIYFCLSNFNSTEHLLQSLPCPVNPSNPLVPGWEFPAFCDQHCSTTPSHSSALEARSLLSASPGSVSKDFSQEGKRVIFILLRLTDFIQDSALQFLIYALTNNMISSVKLKNVLLCVLFIHSSVDGN